MNDKTEDEVQTETENKDEKAFKLRPHHTDKFQEFIDTREREQYHAGVADSASEIERHIHWAFKKYKEIDDLSDDKVDLDTVGKVVVGYIEMCRKEAIEKATKAKEESLAARNALTTHEQVSDDGQYVTMLRSEFIARRRAGMLANYEFRKFYKYIRRNTGEIVNRGLREQLDNMKEVLRLQDWNDND